MTMRMRMRVMKKTQREWERNDLTGWRNPFVQTSTRHLLLVVVVVVEVEVVEEAVVSSASRDLKQRVIYVVVVVVLCEEQDTDMSEVRMKWK
jgi:hypothetical protein